MPQKKQKKALVVRRSVHMTEEMYDNVCKVAKEKHTTPSEIMRSYISKCLTVAFVEDDEGLLRRIVHEEMERVLEHDFERLVKMQVKSAKASAAALFALLALLQNDYLSEMSEEDLLANALKEAALYIRTPEKAGTKYSEEAKEFAKKAKSIGKKDDN